MSCSPWRCKQSDMVERLAQSLIVNSRCSINTFGEMNKPSRLPPFWRPDASSSSSHPSSPLTHSFPTFPAHPSFSSACDLCIPPSVWYSPPSHEPESLCPSLALPSHPCLLLVSIILVTCSPQSLPLPTSLETFLTLGPGSVYFLFIL